MACGGNQFALHAEYNWVPKNLCVPVPDNVSQLHAAFTTVGAIAMQGFRQSDARLGETACVIGLGLVGQILVQILRAAGCRSSASTCRRSAASSPWRRRGRLRHPGRSVLRPDQSNLLA